jgi:hypothetical protein
MKIRMMKKLLAAAIGVAALAFGVQVQAQDAGGPGTGAQGRNAKGAVQREAHGKGAGAMQQRGGQGRGMMMARRRAEGPALAQLDANDDGMISLDEFLARHEDRPELLLERRDENGDGFLSREELEPREGPRRPDIDRAAVQACMQEEHPELAAPAGIEERFDTLDSDDNSLLDTDELAAGRLAQAEERFARLDTDADGQLTQDELRAGRPDRRAMGRDLRDCIRESADSIAP